MSPSSLLSDAFAIYSMAYYRIGQLGLDVVNQEGKDRQRRTINKLIEATRIFRVVERSIILNDTFDGIAWVRGDVAEVNALLIMLKQACDLYDYNVYQTPLTNIVLVQGCNCENSGGGGGGGECGEVSQIDVSEAILVFDMEDGCSKKFHALGEIDGTRTWTIANAAEGSEFTFDFVIDNTLSEGASTHDQTMPSYIKMSDARVVQESPKVWRPYAPGRYFARAWTHDAGATWLLQISDVYT